MSAGGAEEPGPAQGAPSALRPRRGAAGSDGQALVMTSREVRAAVELSDGRGVLQCRGPVWDGLCPRAATDGRVPCEGGRVLALRGTWADGAWIAVARAAGPQCPLARLVTTVPAPWS